MIWAIKDRGPPFFVCEDEIKRLQKINKDLLFVLEIVVLPQLDELAFFETRKRIVEEITKAKEQS